MKREVQSGIDELKHEYGSKITSIRYNMRKTRYNVIISNGIYNIYLETKRKDRQFKKWKRSLK